MPAITPFLHYLVIQQRATDKILLPLAFIIFSRCLLIRFLRCCFHARYKASFRHYGLMLMPPPSDMLALLYMMLIHDLPLPFSPPFAYGAADNYRLI